MLLLTAVLSTLSGIWLGIGFGLGVVALRLYERDTGQTIGSWQRLLVLANTMAMGPMLFREEPNDF